MSEPTEIKGAGVVGATPVGATPLPPPLSDTASSSPTPINVFKDGEKDLIFGQGTAPGAGGEGSAAAVEDGKTGGEGETSADATPTGSSGGIPTLDPKTCGLEGCTPTLKRSASNLKRSNSAFMDLKPPRDAAGAPALSFIPTNKLPVPARSPSQENLESKVSHGGLQHQSLFATSSSARGGDGGAATLAALAAAEEFFDQETDAVSDTGTLEAELEAFISKAMAIKAKVVLVTSGGTTVSLEKNAVRFLDNFSTGTRGAASVEHFIRNGYRVILLQRTGSVAPYGRWFGKHVSAGLDMDFVSALEVGSNKTVEFSRTEATPALVKVVEECRQASEGGVLLHTSFTTLSEYLLKLRICTRALDPCGQDAVVYFGAAVSDFFIPRTFMSKHKIQSVGGRLSLELHPVPKLLGCVKGHWAPHSFCVSFKLETDINILITKAQKALSKYGMDLVIANELKTRYDLVTLVSGDAIEEVHKGSMDDEIERPLVDAVCAKHAAFMGQSEDGATSTAGASSKRRRTESASGANAANTT